MVQLILLECRSTCATHGTINIIRNQLEFKDYGIRKSIVLIIVKKQ